MLTITTFQGLVNWANEVKSDILTCFSVISSDQQTKRIRALMANTSVVPFFECEGEFFNGIRETVFIQFILDEPTGADFYVWCQKNLKRYTQAK